MRGPRNQGVTADDGPGVTGGTSSESLRQPRLGTWGVGLGLLLLASEVVGGWRVAGNPWMGGDLLFHSALANAIVRGELPPGGPYAGLPTYYPPGFHMLLAGVMAALGLDAGRADQLLTLVWLPVLPLGVFLLARWLTGRPSVALVSGALAAFAGGFDLTAGRLWVNSMFMSGHEAYPLYPRDLVFGILPFAVLAFLRALVADGRTKALALAAIAGALFGAAALTQVQLLVPLPVALLLAAALVAVRRPARRLRALLVVTVTGTVALALFVPWFGPMLAIIRQNGASLDLSDAMTAATYGPWNYPREFGLLLPLALVGVGVGVLLLRRPDGPRPRGADEGTWRPAMAEGSLAMAAWFVVAFGLAMAYQSSWPLESALRPQRMWLLASEPMAVLAAMGLVTLAEDVAARARASLAPARRLSLAAGMVALAVLAASAPTALATTRLLAGTWTRATYADLDLAGDRVPSFDQLLPGRTPRATVLTYEDWSALVWFETGETVVGMLPPGYAKLAFDPAAFTAHGQDARRADLLAAFDGAPASVVAAAREYDASFVVLARRGSQLALFDAAAAVAATLPGSTAGSATTVAGNGWDGVALGPTSSLRLAVAAEGDLDLEIRVTSPPGDATSPPAAAASPLSFDIAVVGADGAVRSTAGLSTPTTLEFEVLRTRVRLATGDHLVITANTPVTIQSVRGFSSTGAVGIGDSPVPGWTITGVTDRAVVLEPDGSR